MTDKVKLNHALDMLYKARWNVPQAASYCGLPHQEMVDLFSKEATVGRLLPQKWGIPTAIQLSLGL
jgi:hypothetical protein